MKESILFEFSGRDSMAQFGVFLLVVGAGALPAPILVWQFGGVVAGTASVVVALVVLLGLRSSIEVTRSETVITRKWLFIPYRRYRAPAIEDVWYGGDWGDSEDASGVVVQLGAREIHIGSGKTMHHLFRSLTPKSEPR